MVGVSKRLKVMAEKPLLLRGLGQGAIGYACQLRPRQLFCSSWACCERQRGPAGKNLQHLVMADTLTKTLNNGESWTCPAHTLIHQAEKERLMALSSR